MPAHPTPAVTAAEQLWQPLEEARQMPDRRALHFLSGLLTEDETRLSRLWPSLPLLVRRELIQTLSEMAEADYELDFAACFRLALFDTDPQVRMVAIEGLWEDEDVRLIPSFCQLLLEDEYAQVRAAAAQALARFILLGELKKIRPRPFEMAHQALLAAHRKAGEDLEVRRRTLEALAYLGTQEIVALIEQAYASPDESLRISAIFAMGRNADRRWANIVRKELQSLNPAMRYEATRACGEMELRAAVRELIYLIEDVDPEVQQMALWSLGQIGGDLARRTLERYAHADNEALSEAAQEALAELDFFHGDSARFFAPPEALEESESEDDELDLWADEDDDTGDELEWSD